MKNQIAVTKAQIRWKDDAENGKEKFERRKAQALPLFREEPSRVGKAFLNMKWTALVMAAAVIFLCSFCACAKAETGKWGTCKWDISEAGVLTIHQGTGASTDGICPWKQYAEKIVQVVAKEPILLPWNASSLLALNFTDDSGELSSNCISMDLSGLDASYVRDMNGMFYGCCALKSLDISGFQTPYLTNMQHMFDRCHSLESLNLNGLDTSSVTDMSYLFFQCESLKSLDLSGLDTSRITSARCMFESCSSLQTLDVSGFDTSNVTDMCSMFNSCRSITSLDVSSFDTSRVTDMGWMFSSCESLTSLDMRGFDTSKVTRTHSMFESCRSMQTLDVSMLDTSSVTDMGWMFYNCSGLTELNLRSFDTSSAENMALMFAYCHGLTALDLSSFSTSRVTNMDWMFFDCYALTALDVSTFDTSRVTNMTYMFYNCSKLTALDVSGFNTSNVTNMANMFTFCGSVTALDVSGFNTSKVSSMHSLFDCCYNVQALDVSGFDTSNVTDMCGMFNSCRKLTNLNVRGFDTSFVTDMGWMFYNCSGLTELDLSSFDTSKVTRMHSMFEGCSGLRALDVSRFDTSRATDMGRMFCNCSGLIELNAGNLSVSQADSASYLFAECRSLRSLVFPTSMKEMPPFVVDGCLSLEQLFIPATVEKIPDAALGGYTGEVVFTGDPPVLSETMFSDYAVVKIVYPADNPAWNGVNKGKYGAGVATWLASGTGLPDKPDTTQEAYERLKNNGYDNVWNIMALIYHTVDAPNCQDSYSDEELARIKSGLNNLPAALSGLSNGNMQVGSFNILTIDTPIKTVSNSDGSLTYGVDGDVNFDYLFDHKDTQLVIIFAPVGKIAVGWAGLGGGWVYHNNQNVYSVLLNGSFNWESSWSRNGKSYPLNTLLLVHEICHSLETNSRANGWNGFVPLHDNLTCGYAYNPHCDYIQWYADLMADTIITGGEGFKKVTYLIRHRQIENGMENGIHLDYDGALRVYRNGLLDLNAKAAEFKGTLYPVEGGTLISYENVMQTPANLTAIEAEAFLESGFQWVVLSEQVASIQSRSFADCAELRGIVIPPSVQFIAPDAFDHSPNAVLYTRDNPYAEGWAREHGVACVICP